MCLDVQKVSVPEGIDSAGYLFWETSTGYKFKSLIKCLILQEDYQEI